MQFYVQNESKMEPQNGRQASKARPPPPGKPVTFYECHPDDHAPAPSVRADFVLRVYTMLSCMLTCTLNSYLSCALRMAQD